MTPRRWLRAARAALRVVGPLMLIDGLLHLDPVGFGIGTVLVTALILSGSATRP